MEMENGKGDEEERNGRVGLEASVTRPLIGQALFHTPTFIIIIIIFSFFSSFLFLFFTLIPPRSIPPPPHLHPQSSAGLTIALSHQIKNHVPSPCYCKGTQVRERGGGPSRTTSPGQTSKSVTPSIPPFVTVT